MKIHRPLFVALALVALGVSVSTRAPAVDYTECNDACEACMAPCKDSACMKRCTAESAGCCVAYGRKPPASIICQGETWSHTSSTPAIG